MTAKTGEVLLGSRVRFSCGPYVSARGCELSAEVGLNSISTLCTWVDTELKPFATLALNKTNTRFALLEGGFGNQPRSAWISLLTYGPEENFREVQPPVNVMESAVVLV